MTAMTWEEWLASREQKRENLRRLGLDVPSRRTVSFNSSERFMRHAFGGRRVPAWAERLSGEPPRTSRDGENGIMSP